MGTIEPGKSQDVAFGNEKSKQPKGTDKLEAVFVGGNFKDSEFKGNAATLAPEQRPMKGG